MLSIKQRHLLLISRRFWGFFLGAVISFAVLVQIGRQAFPLMNDYRHIIAESLGAQMGVDVEIGHITAEWEGLRPEVALNQLVVRARSGEAIFTVDAARAELSILDSILQRGFAWRKIHFERFHTTLLQKEDHSWRIRGYQGTAGQEEGSFLFDDPLDVFLFGRRVEISEASLDLVFFSGKRTELSIPSISLENDRFFHRMSAAFLIDNAESLNLVIEGYGDPRDRDAFSASGYVQLLNIPTSDVYNAIVKRTESEPLGDEAPRVDGDTHTLNLELWFKGSPQAGMTASGHLEVAGVPEALEAQLDLPEYASASIAGAWNQDRGWYLNLQDLDIRWADAQLPLDIMHFYGRGKTVGARIAHIDVAAFVDIFLRANEGRESGLLTAISTLQPEGQLNNIDVQLTTPEQGWFAAKANVAGGGTAAFMGSPELRQISGYVEASAFGGYIDAEIPEDFKLHLVKVFDEPFVLDRVRGQLAWRVDPKARVAYLESSRLSAEQGDKAVSGYFAMRLPFKREVGEPWLNLSLAVNHANAEEYAPYLPKKVPRALTDWLASAIQGGEVQNIDVFYSGSVDKGPAFKPSYQIAAQVRDATLEFDPKWPRVERLDGRLLIDSDQFSAYLSAGQSGQNQLLGGRALMYGDEQSGRFIRIHAGMHGPLPAAKRVLLASPLESQLAGFLPTWQLAGEYQAELQLDIPVEYDLEKVDYAVTVEVDDADVLLERVDLAIESVSGAFQYSREHLLTSDGMNAEVWGRPARFSASSDKEAQTIQLDIEAEVDRDKLMRWSQRPEFAFIDGDFDAEGTLRIPLSDDTELEGPTLNLITSLAGNTIALPAPLGKSAEEDGTFALQVTMLNEGQFRYDYDHDGRMNMRLWTSPDLSPSLAMVVGGTAAPLRAPPTGVAQISGVIPVARYEEWALTIDQLLSHQAALAQFSTQKSDAEEMTFLTQADFGIDRLHFGELALDDLGLQIRGDAHAWTFRGRSDHFDGSIMVPRDGSRHRVEVAYLSLFEDEAEAEIEEEFESALSDVDLSELEPVEVRIDELRLSNEAWGSWAFTLFPIDHGIHLSNLTANLRGLRIGRPAPADFVWTKKGEQHQSTFIGSIDTDDVGDALEAWGQERLLESESAKFRIHASWMAPPDAVALALLDGDIALQLRNGSFLSGAEAGENPLLRLIALFNFDTIARRLRLDFSDLAAKGFAYDSVSSKLRFNEGVVTMATPLQVDSSSSKMQVAGTVNLLDETIDAELVVTLPVAGNLAVATAFVVGLPAGVGVYVVSKMLGKHVDKASSINYSIEGDWVDPKFKVRRIFDDEAAKKKGATLAE